ncbi:hypothetical protein [Sediminibacillus albus]|uniref:Uncharacterized protein n=1 Tax=Sediminibacillus albus TaxID=407036 RepID=A0A1G9B5K9_9BACI|nr:hypothetical protein [Sediminibacillus albus]SDK34811.1 hypothetical protein SAMN05216243_2826 [Sediminibacillus albus]
MKIRLLSLLLLSFVLTACATTKSEEDPPNSDGLHNQAYPNVEQILSKNENVDIFQWNKRIYQTNVDSIENSELSKQELLGTIESVYQEGVDFADRMATKLPEGTKIYATDQTGILIAEYDGETKRYLAMIED